MCTTCSAPLDGITPELHDQILARAQQVADSLPELTPRQQQVVRSCLGDAPRLSRSA